MNLSRRAVRPLTKYELKIDLTTYKFDLPACSVYKEFDLFPCQVANVQKLCLLYTISICEAANIS